MDCTVSRPYVTNGVGKMYVLYVCVGLPVFTLMKNYLTMKLRRFKSTIEKLNIVVN